MDLEMWKTVWHTRLNDMKQLWRQHGREPDFYSRFYLPRALEMTGCKLELTE
jgi:hypothetical protein